MSDNESVQNIFNEIIWYYKYHFEDWLPLVCNAESKRFTFLGREGGKHITGKRVIIKLFVLNDQSLLDILREEYLLACGKPSDYFVEIIDTIISKNKYIYLVLREEGVNLRDFINCQQYNYSDSDPDYARFIIFRIACGLKVLHDKGLSHNDIKPGNIVIQGQGKVKICDLGSTDKASQKRCGTNGYFSPQVLLKEYNTEKDDMWSLGIVFLELIKKQTEIFALKIDQEVEDIRRTRLQYILTKLYDNRLVVCSLKKFCNTVLWFSANNCRYLNISLIIFKFSMSILGSIILVLFFKFSKISLFIKSLI